MVTFKLDGDFSKTRHFFNKIIEAVKKGVLDKYGREGVAALASATPIDSGLTADSWHYQIEPEIGYTAITFLNSNINKGVNIAIILQYGHGTGTGGYVQGRDYINPAIQPVFDKMANDVWKEVIAL